MTADTRWVEPRQLNEPRQHVAVLRFVRGNDIIGVVSLDAWSHSMIIGRDEGCNIVIDDATVSHMHCRIERCVDGRMAIVDMDSLNGLYIAPYGPEHGYRRIRRAALSLGSFVQIGDVTMIAVDAKCECPITVRRHSAYVRTAVLAFGSHSAVAHRTGLPREEIDRVMARVTRKSIHRTHPQTKCKSQQAGESV